MKKLLLIISFIFLLIQINKAQNYYPDPSFENYNHCPNTFDELSRGILRNVFPANRSYEANYYHTCGISVYSPPSTHFGYQFPRHGNGFVGIACYDEDGDNDNGYIEARLTDSLIAGKSYLVKFYVNHPNLFEFAIWKIGAYFSRDSLYIPTGVPITTVVPQIANDSGRFLTDTIGWMEICGIYHALGGEKFITIGTFYRAASTPILSMRPSSYHDDVFYFIEDVVVTDSTSIIDTINICHNDSILLANEWRKTSGLYYDSFSCGATKAWYLNVRPESSSFIFIDSTICSHDTVYIDGIGFQRMVFTILD